VKTQLGVGESGALDPSIDQTVAASSASASASLVGPAQAGAGEPARGDSIGRFVVLGVLGRGGMGVVYSAYDPHLDRKVAIKLLTQAMHSAEATTGATARLLREAQAMAKINHPNVIKVHEVDTFAEQIYLAMEFADGGTLRDWLEKPHTLDEILSVFLLAGRGLVAAHDVGLVHRDFKPDNVLMSKAGGVQVTDFGLVSVVDALPRAVSIPPPDMALTNATPLSQDLTRTGSIMGTPTYMAPEQFSGQLSTTRTDQFSFCVALYEALYKERPFAGATYVALSANVLTGTVLPTPAGAKVPNTIRRALLRGLATEPANRHASMGELLALLTRDPTVRRRRIAWAGVGAVALAALGLGLVATRHDGADCGTGDDRVASVWNNALRHRMSAAFIATSRPDAKATFARVTPIVDAWTRDWKSGFVDSCRANQRGEQSAHVLDLRMQCLQRALEVTASTLDVLVAGGVDAVDRAIPIALKLPAVATCADTTARTSEVAPPEPGIMQVHVVAVRAQLMIERERFLLGRYATGIARATQLVAEARATNYPPVVAETLVLLGKYQSGLADPASNASLSEAVRIAIAVGDPNTAIEAAAKWIFDLAETNHYEPAQALGDLIDAMAKHVRPKPQIAVQLGNSVAFLLEKRGKAKEAEARFLETEAFGRRTFGPDSSWVVETVHALGDLYKEEGRYADARKALEEVVAQRKKFAGEDHPEYADALNDMGNVYRVEGDLDHAKALYDRALAIRLAALGRDHPDVGTSYNNLGNYFSDAGDVVNAQASYEKALAVWEKAYGKDNVELVIALTNLGNTLNTRGDHKGARSQFERALTLVETTRGPDHPTLAGVLTNLGVVAADEHRYTDALVLYERAKAITVKAYGAEHPDVADDMINIISVYKSLGKLQEAEELTERTIALVTKVYGPDDPRMGGVLINFGELQMVEKKYAPALETERKALAIFEAKLGPDHPYVAYACLGISRALVELHRGTEGVPFAERGLAIRVATKASPADLAAAHFVLAGALIETSKVPKLRARGISEMKLALTGYLAAEDTENAKEAKAWLRKH